VAQLLRRRRLRILLAFAGGDPTDQLGVVRVMLKLCTDQKLASFFDPKDPRRDLHKYLDEFRDDKERMYLHIGIFYPADEAAGLAEKVGKLVLFKNRLPPSWTEEDNPYRFSMRHLLSEAEILFPNKYEEGLAGGEEDDPLLKMYPEELGGIGCCDCCHRRGVNFGPKFPNLNGLNYMTLTPQLFNCLCRLGRAVCTAGIYEVFRNDEEMEEHVPDDGARWTQHISTVFSHAMSRRGSTLSAQLFSHLPQGGAHRGTILL